MSSLPSQTFSRQLPGRPTPGHAFFQRKATRRSLFAFLLLVLIAIVATIVLAINLRRDLRTSLPQLDGQISIAGLTAPVTITRDAHGVPSIHAANLDDLLFAQGFITAQDRLFQMDALRRHGAGELAEILGPSLIDHDRQQRYLQLRATADRAVSILPPDQLHQLQTYARGVNAFISAHSGKDAYSGQDAHNGQTKTTNTLPVEFHLLRYTPTPWLPRDSLLISLVMSQDLSTEFPTKLNREALSAHLPAALLPDLYPTGSWRDHPPAQTPTDLTTPTDSVDQIPLDKTQSFNQPCPHTPYKSGCPFHAAVSSSGERAGHKSPGPTATPHDLADITLAVRAGLCEGCVFGSNNWAIAGSHSVSGAALLSNDMHLGLTAPDIWYEAALHIDPPTDAALDVTGFTLPGIPFVIVGRNAHVAWSFTNSGADVQDVLIEHFRGHGNQTEFEHPDHTWSLVQHQTEFIHVRAGRDITLDILLTAHALGDKTIPTPIISPLYPTERRALALAWTVYDPATITSPMYSINTATDAASLLAAFAGFASVSENLIYADAHHIGYHLLGRIPIRGPAAQHPRATAPFILPDKTPPEDEEEEDGALRIPTDPHLVRSALTLSFRPEHRGLISMRSGETSVLAFRRNTPGPQADIAQLPITPTTPYTIGSPLSPIPIDGLDPTQAWSGYIPYDALPSILDPTSGILATANSRVATDDYPYSIANNWSDPYRAERIYHLLQNRSALTPADMLAIQTDTHSDFDLLVAQRLAYALDHAALAQTDPRLRQAADLLRDFNGDMSPNSPAAAIVAATRAQLWPMLLAPQLRAIHPTPIDPDVPRTKPHKLSALDIAELIDLYTWEEKTSALEQLLQHTPARWLPHAYATWNDLLAAAIQQGLNRSAAPTNLSTWTYGTLNPVEIPHPIFASHSLFSRLLGLRTGTGIQPTGGDGTTIKAAGLHFGPSERFTANLADPDDTHANITTGQSGNPASPWFLDQFPAWLQGTTLTLPLNHPTTTHTLTLNPK
jgi:penicillin G amidase